MRRVLLDENMPRKLQLIQVPYDSGHENTRMGKGPEYFLRHGVVEHLHAKGHDVHVERIEATDGFPTEISTTFELCRLLAERVREATKAKRFPLILAGNCNSSLGTLAGLEAPDEIGIVWFDAHADFNTPETTSSGFLDGMALSITTGHCWKRMAASIPGFSPVPEDQVLLVGGRSFDPPEQARLEASDLTFIAPASIGEGGARSALEPALSALPERTQSVYIHVDMDVLDPEEAHVNPYVAPDGLTVGQVAEAVRLVAERFSVSAAALTAYDPNYDADGRALEAGMKLLEVLAQTAGEGYT